MHTCMHTYIHTYIPKRVFDWETPLRYQELLSDSQWQRWEMTIFGLNLDSKTVRACARPAFFIFDGGCVKFFFLNLFNEEVIM